MYLYSDKLIKPSIDFNKTESMVINPANESVKIDAKNLTIESSGLITWVVIIGLFATSGLYIYGKFFHERIRGWKNKRRLKNK